IASTRKTLERVPMEKADWQPHPKSMPMGRLASHLATLPSWTVETMTRDELDMAPPGGEPYKPELFTTSEALLEAFDRHAEAARAALAGASDETMAGMWTLKAGGNALFAQPRAGVYRGFVMSHLIHHRAQLG